MIGRVASQIRVPLDEAVVTGQRKLAAMRNFGIGGMPAYKNAEAKRETGVWEEVGKLHREPIVRNWIGEEGRCWPRPKCEHAAFVAMKAYHQPKQTDRGVTATTMNVMSDCVR